MNGCHLSRFLPGTPPPPIIQKLNAILHTEPFASTFYCLIWSVLLMVGALISILVLMATLVYSQMQYWIGKKSTYKNVVPCSKDRQLAVVITGCDTGFGKELAFRMASEGFYVFAGILQEQSRDVFRGEPNIQPLLLDVTKDSDVQSAVRTVQDWIKNDKDEHDRGQRLLHALINNAGLGRFGLIDWIQLDDFELCMQVNCYGSIRMVKAFLPILKSQIIKRQYTDSQIVNIVSVAGLIPSSGLGGVAYEVSKHAMEAFSDSLRLELKSFEIQVVSVNPSFHSTDMVSKFTTNSEYQRVWDSLSKDQQHEYGTTFVQNFTEHIHKMISSSVWDMKTAIDTLVDYVILSSVPPGQIIIGMDFRYSGIGMRMLPQWVRHAITLIFLPNLTPATMQSQNHTKK